MSGARPTVLVTGAAGFIGRAVRARFAAEGWRVVGIDAVPDDGAVPGEHHRLTLPAPALRGLVRGARPTALVHCAGRASVERSRSEPQDDFQAHTVVTFEVLEALRREAPACRFVNLSSAAVYGNPRTLPVDERQEPAPLSPYGFHKWQTDLLAREYAQVFGLPTASLRVFSAYGPGLRRQVVWDVARQALGSGQVRLRGTGAESRDFVHVDDVARAVLTVATGEAAPGEVYNLGSGQELTIRALAEQVLALVGRRDAPEFTGEVDAASPRNWRADVSRLLALGYQPEVPFERGLAEFVAWARAEAGTRP